LTKVVEVQAVTLLLNIVGDCSFLRLKARPADRAIVISIKMISQVIRLFSDCVEFEFAVDEDWGAGLSLVEGSFCSVE
jgi:hypothetical protein